MMVRFGFSIYPERHSLEKMKAYIDWLAGQGASRVFMSLLQISPENTEVFEKYLSLVAHAKQLGLAVIADVSPDFMKQHAWEGQLIDKAREFGLSGIRLDEALPLDEIVTLTNNPYHIKIELNMSSDKRLLEDLLASSANKQNIIACHNFYPHAFTGLSMAHFLEMSMYFHNHGIKTATFITAHSAEEGPWPLSEGLCTLEDCRNQSVSNQVTLLKETGLIDDILIANQFISPDELCELTTALEEPRLVFDVEALSDVSAVERKIIAFDHCYRGDISDYVIRSTWSRVAYAKESVDPRQQSKSVRRGMVLIDNDLYGRYKGELQIALKDFEVSDKVNIVGQLSADSMVLLPYLRPWQKFKLVITKSVNQFQ